MLAQGQADHRVLRVTWIGYRPLDRESCVEAPTGVEQAG